MKPRQGKIIIVEIDIVGQWTILVILKPSGYIDSE